MSSEIDTNITRVFLLRLLKSFHALPVPCLLVAASSLTESLFSVVTMCCPLVPCAFIIFIELPPPRGSVAAVA